VMGRAQELGSEHVHVDDHHRRARRHELSGDRL
jgi:hypothetical protein